MELIIGLIITFSLCWVIHGSRWGYSQIDDYRVGPKYAWFRYKRLCFFVRKWEIEIIWSNPKTFSYTRLFHIDLGGGDDSWVR